MGSYSSWLLRGKDDRLLCATPQSLMREMSLSSLPGMNERPEGSFTVLQASPSALPFAEGSSTGAIRGLFKSFACGPHAKFSLR